MRNVRYAGFAGVLSFGLLVVAGLISPLWNLPPTDAGIREIAQYAADHRGDLIAALYVFGLAMALFLFFAAGLYAWLREREPPPRVLSTAFAFGAISLATLVFAGFVPMSALAYRAPPLEAQTLFDLAFGLLAFSGLPTAVALFAYAGLVLGSTRALPAWTGWPALIAAVAHVAIAASFAFSHGFLSLEGAAIVVIPSTLFVWILATAIALVRVPDG
jgi:hypothetical protein